MEYVVGYTSGLARSTFIVNAPDGYGKTPMLPEYTLSRGRGKLLLRTWEGRVFEYENADAPGKIEDLELDLELDD